jgi:hypothetical protein
MGNYHSTRKKINFDIVVLAENQNRKGLFSKFKKFPQRLKRTSKEE